MNKYFFTYIDDIPKALHNRLFSQQHLLAIFMVVCLCTLINILVGKKSSEWKWRFVTLASLILPLLELAQVLWYKGVGHFSCGYTLPLHLCNLMCIFMPLMTITKNKLLMEYSYAMGLIPAGLAILTPDAFYYPSISFIYIQTMLGHGIICFIPIFLVFNLNFKPDIRKLPKVIGMLVGLAVVITPINIITNGNYFFLRYPAEGSPMEFFARIIGRPWYLIPTFLLGVILWLIAYLPFIVMSYRKNISERTQKKYILSN